MTDENLPNKMGRPEKVIDWEQFRRLCGIHCTKREIAAFFDCHEDTLDAACKREFGVTFSTLYEQKADLGRISLRRNQFKAAEKGNTAMLIWLGKQWLAQTDSVAADLNDEPIKLAYDPQKIGKAE